MHNLTVLMLLMMISLLAEGCTYRLAPAQYEIDQNSLMVGKLQGEVETLKWALNRERGIMVPYK